VEIPNWEKLEILVTKIQKALAPEATVEHNVKLPGVHSETMRQVDVLISQKIGQYDMRIIVDCKDYNKPVNVKCIEEFSGLIQDTGVNKGAMVCPKGFSDAAKKRARKLQIDLYSPVDTDPHKWQVQVTAPVLCKSRNCRFGFGIRHSAPIPFKIPEKFYEMTEVFDKDGSPLGTPLQIFKRRWNERLYPDEAGEHKRIPLHGDLSCFIDNGYGVRTFVDLTVNLEVTEQHYFGSVPIERISGLKDEQTGLVHSREFVTKFASVKEILEKWKEIDPQSPPPSTPLFQVIIAEYFEPI
jgi:hypothetical protein